MPKKNNAQRADGRFAVSVYLGIVDGKNKYKTVYGKTQKEANAKADEIRQQIKAGRNMVSGKKLLSDVAALWLKGKTATVSTRQLETLGSFVKKISDYFEGVNIEDIKPIDLQDMLNDMAIKNSTTGKPSAKSTLDDYRKTLMQIFDFALYNEIISKNPALKLQVSKTALQTQRRSLTEEEIGWIENTPHRMQLAAMIMLYAGLRRGELIPLTWNDIDLKEGTISVNKAVEMVKDKPVVKTITKTQAGMRTVFIPKKLIQYLKKQRRNSVIVFPNENSGEMYTASAWQSAWSAYLNDLDVLYGKTPQKKSKYDKRFGGRTIPNITAHWLRHTFATMMYLAGIDVLTAKEQLGHSDIQTTLRIYTHLDTVYKQKSMSKLDVYLSKENQYVGQMSVKNADNR